MRLSLRSVPTYDSMTQEEMEKFSLRILFQKLDHWVLLPPDDGLLLLKASLQDMAAHTRLLGPRLQMPFLPPVQLQLSSQQQQAGSAPHLDPRRGYAQECRTLR